MSDSISGLTGAGGGDMMRIVGMATGLDVDSMVKKMLLAEQAKIDHAKQKKQSIVWKQEMYRDIIKDVKELQDTYFNVTSKDCITSAKNYFDHDVTSINSTVATATAGEGVLEGNYNVKVDKLARVAQLKGNSLFIQGEIAKDASGQIDISTWKGKTIEINGQSINIDNSENIKTVSDLINNINGQISNNTELSGKLSVSYIKDGDNHYIKFNKLSNEVSVKIDNTTVTGLNTGEIKSINSFTKLSDVGLDVDTLNFKINYNGKDSKDIILGKDKTIQDLINTINTDENLKGSVKASFDNTTGKIVINSSKTGSTENIKIIGDDNLQKLGLNNNASAQGQDALFNITKPDGSQITMTESKNDFTLNGVNYSLKGQGETSLNVKKDVDKTFDRIVKFMDKYNSLIDKINTKVTEKKDYSYKPLTESQRKEMKEDEIKSWEEQAKKGVLRNDDNLQNMLQSLRATFFEAVEGAEASFGQSIGIDTEGKYSKAGQIKFTDGTGAKFKEALKENPEGIMKLFTQTGKLTEEESKLPETKQKEILNKKSGIFQRMDSIIRDYVGIPGTTLNSAILTKYANKQEDYSLHGSGGSNTLPDQIYKHDNKVKELSKKMFKKQELLYKKFSRLEVAMNKYNAQAGWLMQQFGGQ
ncbi:flagellar capping protein [Clostridium acetireducens DSM 10703]|uniref:Flagellar hook-associated protein 2 n=1 Tax=Clostridium acetireducens DSM 10703 TaxID=1121290 RepID=A0A1E8EZF8_9CLOT|nr:flagellar filament capping protein FliD [Clostridium acetireducens]OFI06503.1 flagellar capping protein [Clostridium acetireducens DSM 10703]